MTRIGGAFGLAACLAALQPVAAQPPSEKTVSPMDITTAKPAEGVPGPKEATIARNCMTCHGPQGVSPNAVPTLAGKTADYIALRLTEFRDGKRPSTIMGRIMVPFADEDIRNVAAYFAAETVEVTK